MTAPTVFSPVLSAIHNSWPYLGSDVVVALVTGALGLLAFELL